MSTLLLITNIATAILAIVYYVRFHWADDELQITTRALENSIQKLARSHEYQRQIRDFYLKEAENDTNNN